MTETKSNRQSILWLCSLVLEDLNNLTTLSAPSTAPTSSLKYSQFTKIIILILKRNLVLLREDQDCFLFSSLMKRYEREILLILKYFHHTLLDISQQKENHFGIFDVRKHSLWRFRLMLLSGFQTRL
jgi:hypothetical protein